MHDCHQQLQWWKAMPFTSVWVSTTSMAPCVSPCFNGRYKLWWNITSLFMSVCQHMWVERCASEELSLCECVGGILYVFISILENLSEAAESDKEGESHVMTWRSVLLHSPCCLQHFCPFLNRDMLRLCTCSCCVLAVILVELIAYAERCIPVMWFTSVEPFR